MVVEGIKVAQYKTIMEALHKKKKNLYIILYILYFHTHWQHNDLQDLRYGIF